MIRVSFLELIARAIPESLIFVWACYVLSKTKIHYKEYIISSLLLGVLGYLVRLLPIQFGINTVLNLSALIFFNIKINKIAVTKSIQLSLTIMILEFMCEFFNMVLIKFVFKLDMTYVFSNPRLKIIYGIPSLALLILVVIIINLCSNKTSSRKPQDI